MSEKYTNTDKVRRFICLEGMPGAGKTTVWSTLKSCPELYRLDLYFSEVLIESASIAQKKKERGAAAALDADTWYYQQEEHRLGNIREKILAGFNVVSDRSVLSTLAFAYARGKLEGKMESYQRLLSMFRQNGKGLLPDYFIVLMVDLDVSIERRKTASPERSIGPWENSDFLKYFYEFYETEMRSCFTQENTQWIDTTRLTKEKEAQMVINSILQVCSKPTISHLNLLFHP